MKHFLLLFGVKLVDDFVVLDEVVFGVARKLLLQPIVLAYLRNRGNAFFEAFLLLSYFRQSVADFVDQEHENSHSYDKSAGVPSICNTTTRITSI